VDARGGRFHPCTIYDRAKLKPGNRISGPAIIEQMDTTTIVLPDMLVTVEEHLNLILVRTPGIKGATDRPVAPD
jgi:N-methylhydantoinase A/oxoprolinase/acetone carboxylase beta subunit